MKRESTWKGKVFNVEKCGVKGTDKVIENSAEIYVVYRDVFNFFN